MASKRPTTVEEYIEACPEQVQPHLRALRAILREAAPHAEELIKWNAPFFVEPRFLFSFSGFKAHVNFAVTEECLAHFKDDLKSHRTTKFFLQVPHDEPLPADLIRRMAEYRVRVVSERQTQSFW